MQSQDIEMDNREDSSTDGAQSERRPRRIRVLVPVTVSLLVPVEMDDLRADGDDSTDILVSQSAAAMAMAAVESVCKGEPGQEALTLLLSAVDLYRQTYPDTRAQYTPALGLVQESDY